MDKTLQVQHQIRQNAEELEDYLKDLVSWEKEMKVKEEEIKKRTHDDTALPPIRTANYGKKKKKKDKKSDVAKEKAKKSKEEEKSMKTGRIPGHDYRAWELFNVDEALKDLDEHEKEANKKSSSEEEDESEESESDLYDLEKKKQLALIEKDKGNQYFKKRNYDMAIICYTVGIEYDPNNALLPANRAMALLKKGQLAAAEMDCSTCISIDPTYVKAYLRRGTARLGLKKYEEARQDFTKVLDLEPDNNQAKLELERLQKEILATKNKITVDSTESEKVGNKFIEVPVNKEQGTELESKSKIITNAHQPSDVHNLGGGEKVILANKPDDRLLKLLKPEDKDSCLIKPIQKSPHLRSQKPVKRIIVKDVSGIPECNSPTDDGKQISVLNTSETSTEENIHKERMAANPVKVSEAPTICPVVEEGKPSDLGSSNEGYMNVEHSNFSSESSTKSSEIVISASLILPSLPAVPVTSYQFLADWKKLKNYPDLLYEYIKQFPPEKLPVVFKQSIDTELFCGILQVLSTKFVEKCEDVFVYLNHMRKVGRFKTLVMFLAEEEIIALNHLFQSIRSSEKYSLEEIQNVEKDYGLS